MKLGPDGSLCRITSSAKGLVSNFRIIKVPDSKPSYKIVMIKPNDTREESSEESELASDDEPCDLKIPSENTEREEVIDKSKETVHKGTVNKKTVNKESRNKETLRSRNFSNNRRPYFKRSNYNRFYDRRQDNFNSKSRKYENPSGRERNYNYGSQNFISEPSRSETYTSAQHPSDDIPTWETPPVLVNTFSLTPFQHVPRKEGLLGDHPSYGPPLPQFLSNNQNDVHDQNSTYSPMASSFQSSTQSESFICDDSSPYSPMASSFASSNRDGFIRNQDSSYSRMPSNYPSQENYRGYYNKKNWFQKKNNWNQKQRRHPVERNNAPFEYRH